MEQLCKIRDLQRALIQYESDFAKRYGICLNEGMVLCSLKNKGRLTSGQLCDLLGLTSSNTSKVIRSVEEKGLVSRVLGKEDRRQMYFSLTEKGKDLISSLRCDEVSIPEILEKAIKDIQG